MKSALLGLSMLPLLALTTGCVDNDSSMYVEAVLAAVPPNCEYKADPSSTQLLTGVLDVAFLNSYEGAVLVANQLTPRGIKNQLRAETSGVELQGAEITLTRANGAALDEFSVPAGGFVHSNTSQGPGYGMAFVTMIPPNVGNDLRAELVARLNQAGARRGASLTVIASIRVFGTTLGGTEITSGEFTFPIDVCYGCLIDFPIDAVENPGDGRICAGTGESVAAQQCIRGQDAVIDCRTCAATLEVCALVD